MLVSWLRGCNPATVQLDVVLKTPRVLTAVKVFPAILEMEWMKECQHHGDAGWCCLIVHVKSEGGKVMFLGQFDCSRMGRFWWCSWS